MFSILTNKGELKRVIQKDQNPIAPSPLSPFPKSSTLPVPAMENHHSSAAPPNGKGQTTSSGCPEKKDVAMPNLISSSAAKVSATAAGATSNGNNLSKGKSVAPASAAADNNKEQELKPHIIAERKRRVRINDHFRELQSLVPQIPAKSGKGTIVGHAIHYIQSLERTKAMLEKRKQQQALARQAAAASSSLAPPPPPPQSMIQGMAAAAMSPDVPNAYSDVLPPPLPLPLQPPASAVPVPVPAPQPLQPLPGVVTAPPPPPPPPQLPAPAGPEFKTWTWPGFVVNVSNDSAYLNLCVPRERGTRTMVTVVSVLNKYGIDVLTAQVDSDAVRTVLNIYARVTAMGGEIPSAEDMYKQAVSEILALLNAS